MGRSSVLRCTAAICLALFAVACKRERWHGYVYPDRADRSKHIQLGPFSTFEECRAATTARLSKLPKRRNDPLVVSDYECGLNCEGDAFPKLCDDTRR